ncbi:MAG: hypothetical protein IR158_02090 [Cellulomonas sp.]|nr:hypothetical protein [Cellulomonas sp.]
MVTATSFVVGGQVAVASATVATTTTSHCSATPHLVAALPGHGAPGTGSVTPRAGPDDGPAPGRPVGLAHAATTAASPDAGPDVPARDTLRNPA